MNTTSECKKIALKLAIISSFFTPFMLSAVNISLPTIAKEFGADGVLTSWIATSYLLSTSAFLLPFGKIADMVGRKRIFRWGVLIFTISSVVSGLSSNSLMLILARGIQGIGGAMIFGTGAAILTSAFPQNERGKALGLNVSAVYVGLSLGPFVGGFLTEHLSWRVIFFIIVPLGLYCVYLIDKKLDIEWINGDTKDLDLSGSLMYGLSLVILIIGLTKIITLWGLVFFLMGLLFFVVFVIYESKTKHPLVDVRLFLTNRSFIFSNLAALLNYSATFSVTFLLSLYLQHIKLLPPSKSGMLLVVQPVVMAIFSPLSGKLSDRIEPRIISSVGMGITALSLYLFSFLDIETSELFVVAILFLLGVGFALFSSPNANAIMSSVDKKDFGFASAMMGTMRLLGQMFSMAIATFFIAIFIGKKDFFGVSVELIKVLHYNFNVMAILCFIGVFASAFRGNIIRK